MSRRPRLVLPNVPQHIIQRGNNRTACFYANEEDVNSRDWLKEDADKTTECQAHAYVLMIHHVHLLVSAQKAEAIGRMMKALD